MANVISYDLPKLKAAKKKYENYAEEINTLMSKINNLVTGDLSDGWRGDSYQAFLAQNDQQVKPAFDKMSEALRTIGEQISTAEQNAIAADNASKVM